MIDLVKFFYFHSSLSVEKKDEMKCLIKGCNFLIKNVPNEVFTIDHKDFKSSGHEFKSRKNNDSLFPYLLINIGSGVSILKVESEEVFQRIGGSCLGGATLWGLGSLLTNANVIKLANLIVLKQGLLLTLI